MTQASHRHVTNNGTTDDTTPTFNGTLGATLGAGEKVSIYDGATKLGEATVTGRNLDIYPGCALPTALIPSRRRSKILQVPPKSLQVPIMLLSWQPLSVPHSRSPSRGV